MIAKRYPALLVAAALAVAAGGLTAPGPVSAHDDVVVYKVVPTHKPHKRHRHGPPVVYREYRYTEPYYIERVPRPRVYYRYPEHATGSVDLNLNFPFDF